MKDKHHPYSKLVAERQACRACAPLGLTNLSLVDGGAHDSDQIGAWSRWQGDLNARLLLVGQDWGDDACLVKNKGLEPATSATNDRLIQLLDSVGIQIGKPALGEQRALGVFFTNAVLCVKKGGLQARVKNKWFVNCAPFLKRTIELIDPLVVVTLGGRAHRSVCEAFSIKGQARLPMKKAVALPPRSLDGVRSKLVSVYHCSSRVINDKKYGRSWEDQLQDWKRVAAVLKDGAICV